MKSENRLSSLQNIGPATESTLSKLNIYTREQLIKTGSEGVLLELINNYGFEHPHVHTCFLYALEGAIQEVSWLKISLQRKTELQSFMKNLKKNK